jgi:hypothetical protein
MQHPLMYFAHLYTIQAEYCTPVKLPNVLHVHTVEQQYK